MANAREVVVASARVDAGRCCFLFHHQVSCISTGLSPLTPPSDANVLRLANPPRLHLPCLSVISTLILCLSIHHLNTKNACTGGGAKLSRLILVDHTIRPCDVETPLVYAVRADRNHPHRVQLDSVSMVARGSLTAVPANIRNTG
jgi:hypothetical protein